MSKRARAERADEVETVLEALRSGVSAEECFRRLFTLYYRPLCQFFAHRGFPPEECLDLTQETFIGIYTGIESFRRQAGFDTWLFKIATNAYRGRLRLRQAGKRAGEEVPLERLEDPTMERCNNPSSVPAPSQEDELLEKERMTLLVDAITGLPEQMRQCLVLRVDQSLRYREIAVAMKLSPQTVKAHLRQARARLKQQLGSYFELDLADPGEETS